ncbi:MAG: sugar ABC transporter permease [Ruminococcaceae bacterium]|nr:sugar ABC transporter permease [Oscillospiraceae bacterium]
MSKVTIEKMPKRQRVSLERKQNLYGYVFVLPVILGLAFIYIPVVVQSLIYSFSEINVTENGFETVFCGWDNYYQALFVEEGFIRTVVESTAGILIQIPIILIFAFFMANVLNQEFVGKTAARVIFFIPVIISTGIIAEVESMSSMIDIYSSSEKMEIGSASGSGNVFNYAALANLIIQTLNNTDLANIVLGAIDGLYSIITSSGVQMLVFLSGLQGISTSMYEAAQVEGATGWEVFWKISFPYVSPLILVNTIYTVIDQFLKSDNLAVTFINEKLANSSGYALASSLSWIYTLVVLLFVGVVFLLINRMVIYQD